MVPKESHLKCPNGVGETTILYRASDAFHRGSSIVIPRNEKRWRESSTSYITPHGYLAVNGVDFYSQNEYCIDPELVFTSCLKTYYPVRYIKSTFLLQNNNFFRRSEIGELKLKYCLVDCNHKQTPCIHKCCPIGKAVGESGCVPLGKQIWEPHLYHENPEKRVSNAEKSNLQPHFQFVVVEQKCDPKFIVEFLYTDNP